MRTLDCSEGLSAVESLLLRREEENGEIEQRVREILGEIRTGGDAALLRYARELDTPGLELDQIRIGGEELSRARRMVSPEFIRALRAAKRNIERYHRHQQRRSWGIRTKGVRLEQRFLPLSRVGIYVPGGTAAYPSTVLMNAIPAKIAGVPEIAMITPADRDGRVTPEVLVAAAEAGVTEIYRIGGAHGIGALAYGTGSIRAVEKITGPGNAYVATAKKLLFGRVGIDMIAGPTEVLIVADGTADPAFVAADMLAQAEHDLLASAILITTERRLIPLVADELARQLEAAPRKPIAGPALEKHGAFVLVRSLAQAADLVNRMAPEHLEVILRKPEPFLKTIRNAGAIFVGKWSTEALGDYVAGPNHTLPTMGSARFSSALSVYDFLRFTNILRVAREGFNTLAPHAEVLAEAEGLFAHAASVKIRRGTR
jgi:histidinol dehydrogenase